MTRRSIPVRLFIALALSVAIGLAFFLSPYAWGAIRRERDGDGRHGSLQLQPDASGATRWYRITNGSTLVSNGRDVPLVSSIPSREVGGTASAFFLEIGHGAWDAAVGPEVPTYGWEYRNIVLRFHPIVACP